VSENPPPHALLRPGIAFPFLLVGLIWGSTWWVITDQLKGTAPAWSVTWRFLLAAPTMFALAALARQSLRMPARAHVLAMVMGLTQFWGNHNLVYAAERHLTSGIVAVMVSLMIIPNAVLGRFLLGQRITPRFIVGSLIAMAGIALLLLHEARDAAQAGRQGQDVALGALLAIAGLLAASVASVAQANGTGKAAPMLTLIAWAMSYGVVCDAAWAWASTGPPVFPQRADYWFGVAYLAIFGSVITFPLYYRLVRDLGAGRAAYNGILVLIIAMLLSTVLEGYRWSPLAIGGAVLAAVGLVIALRARNPVTKSG